MSGQDFYPTANVFNRILKIRGTSEGTGLVVDIGTFQYLITAAHIIGDRDVSALSVFHNEQWNDYPISVIGIDAKYDVSVLRLPFYLNRRHLPLELGADGIIWGQSVLFLGYPFGEYGLASVFGNGKLPLPFVKRACLSMFGTPGNPQSIILDGINNVGFSGGPIVFSDKGALKVAGIITGYREEQRLLDYAFKEGQVEKAIYAQNTGLIYGAGSKVALDLIESNPTGFPLPESEA